MPGLILSWASRQHMISALFRCVENRVGCLRVTNTGTIGDTYCDTHRNVLVTVEDHEFVGGRRTGRVSLLSRRRERFPRRWICPEQDLVEVLAEGSNPVPGTQAMIPDSVIQEVRTRIDPSR